MSRTTMQYLGSLALIGALAAPVAMAQDPTPPTSAQAAQEPELFTIEELDNLLARVALYPDPILAQLLAAATFPDQVALAARYVRTYGQDGIDDQAWDVSVKSIAHYPPVLNLLDEDPDWATALGQAFAIQEGDVMASVQGLRRMAHAQGNLVTTAEQQVEVEPEYIRIVPAQPRVIYVPTYDPEIIYYRPVHYHRVHSPYWSFGFGFPIGVWLTYDFDWGHRVVYYHGWDGYGRHHTWYHASRPFIYINTVYVAPWRTVVVINRRVVHRYVDYRRFGRYNGIHRRVSWDRRGLPGQYDRDRWADDAGRGRGVYASRRVAADADRTGAAAPRTTTRSAQPRGQGDRVTPIATRPRSEPADAARTTPTRQSTGNGTWNARPTTARRAAPDRSAVPERRTTSTVPRSTTVTRTATTPRTAPDYTRRATTSRSVPMNRTARPSAPQSAPRSMPQRSSAPRATAPSRAPTRASAPPRASAPSRASAPARASAPSRAAPSRAAPSRAAPSRGSAPSGGSSSSRSGGRSAKRGST